MSEVATAARPVGSVAKTARRVAVALTIACAVWLFLLTHRRVSPAAMFFRLIVFALSATLAFAFFEAWPRRLPRWCQRWVLQVGAVGASIAVAAVAMYLPFSSPEARPFIEDNDWMLVTFAAILFAPWTALAAIVRQKEAFARHQKLAFALERSELERQALDARLHLLQAQVAPHFLFNTLANVQALVDAGSPQASSVLRSLIAYLRAAVPLLHEPAATLERELQLVRPYLELMQMRMPDRLQYAMHVDPRRCRCAVRR